MRNRAMGVTAAVFATWAAQALADTTTGPGIGDTDNGFTLSTGLDYSEGRYGAVQTTDILVGLFNASYKTGNFQFTAVMPYLNISGPSYVVIGAGGIPVLVGGKGPTASTVRDGWGDLNLSGTYTVQPEELDGFEADLTARVKPATAKTSEGLSSGEVDYGFSVDVSRQIDIWAPFVSFGYRVPGSPTAYSLNSAPSFSVGTSVQLSDQFLAIVSYDFDGTISNSLADSQQIFASGSWIYNDRLTFTVYTELGLSSGSPRIGTGLLTSWKVP